MNKGKSSTSRIRCSKKTAEIFYRNFGTKNVEATEPPSMAQVEPYWKALTVGRKAQHNERAEWIRREERRKLGNMEWRSMQTMEITSLLSKYYN